MFDLEILIKDDELLIRFYEILTILFLDQHLQRESTFYV